MIWLGVILICVTNFPKDVLAQTGLDCPINYQTIHETVPYCGVSSWLQWNCTGAKPMDTIIRKRAVCCTKGKPVDECLKECNMTAKYDEDSTIAHLVCPFPGMTFPTTTTAATTPPTTPSTKAPIPTTVPLSATRLQGLVLSTWNQSGTMLVNKSAVFDESGDSCSFALWESITATTDAKGNFMNLFHALKSILK